VVVACRVVPPPDDECPYPSAAGPHAGGRDDPPVLEVTLRPYHDWAGRPATIGLLR
jgi:hypothetical protein